MDTDLLDSLLDLEEKFYQEGYNLGVADGTAAGYTEGSVFAVEKGFEKFVEMGRLYGKALVWAQRLADSNSHSSEQLTPVDVSDESFSLDPSICKSMPALPAHSARLARNLATLMELVDPASMDMSNTEEAVNDIDERLKGAAVKAKLIQRAMGEGEETLGPHSSAKDMTKSGDGTGSIEDISALNVRH
ncbi:Essential protein Yae1 N-terminal [Penicillium chermesinum]|uniref:Essential protein Yae1 N-terminal n=1 Tax=Penicillium chermesinum TaxID=63820 RepID=A0A9W9TY64_9EURO|nr:Essential protein Yae1 N-terminal [Penicillium chermesinum]KAJ5248692.1 Essential protein Yae1 N-terminal [Penicillium chermesinum]KAJ6150800.1 Essential protein Yae1 N-terminal [Penicillium chermesinum]